MAHPPTYVNKVLVGSADGRMQLRNINSSELLFTFKLPHRICCIEGSPALDVVGIGLGDGSAVLHNVKYDEEVMCFRNAAGAGTAVAATAGHLKRPSGAAAAGPCTCLAFRYALLGAPGRPAQRHVDATCGLACSADERAYTHQRYACRTGGGTPTLAVGGTAGSVTVWNLESRKLQTVLRAAHGGAVAELFFFPGEPVLMSSGADNSLKHFIFDNEDGSGRLLRFRSGHGAPPQKLLFYGAAGNVLLSAAADQALRAFSVIQDQQSRELSQVWPPGLCRTSPHLVLPVACRAAHVTAME